MRPPAHLTQQPSSTAAQPCQRHKKRAQTGVLGCAWVPLGELKWTQRWKGCTNHKPTTPVLSSNCGARKQHTSLWEHAVDGSLMPPFTHTLGSPCNLRLSSPYPELPSSELSTHDNRPLPVLLPSHHSTHLVQQDVVQVAVPQADQIARHAGGGQGPRVLPARGWRRRAGLALRARFS